MVNYSVPKFDISSQTDLTSGLKALGITDVFDPDISDFSPMTDDMDGIFVSQAQHGARVAIDEEGVSRLHSYSQRRQRRPAGRRGGLHR